MENRDSSDIHSILNHPIRREVLKLIAEKGELHRAFLWLMNS